MIPQFIIRFDFMVGSFIVIKVFLLSLFRESLEGVTMAGALIKKNTLMNFKRDSLTATR